MSTKAPKVQTPLNLILPIKPGRENLEGLAALLKGAAASQPNPIHVALERLGNVHFAQFVVLPMAETVNAPAGGPALTGPPPTHSLAVLTIYDGEFDDYIVSFVEAIGDIFDRILAFIVDAAPVRPVRHNRDAFVAFIKARNFPRDEKEVGRGVFSAYPGRRMLDLRDAVEVA